MPIAQRYELKTLVLNNKLAPFDEWFEALPEEDQIMVDDRLARVRTGSFGEIDEVGV